VSAEIAPGERARLTPEGPTAAVIESRGPLPLRLRHLVPGAGGGRSHPGTAVVVGRDTFEVAAEEPGESGAVRYRLEPWPRDQAIRDRVVYGPRFVRTALEERRRKGRERWAGPALGLVRRVLESVVALLPAPERTSITDRLALDPLRGTVLLLLLQLGAGSLLWAAGFVATQQARLEAEAGEHTRAARGPSDEEIAQAYGPFKGGAEAWSPDTLRPFAYLFTPMALVLEYGVLTGLLRGLHLVAARQPLGDPILSLVLASGRARRARRREREAAQAFGPQRADRQSRQGDDIVIVSARPKQGWREGAAVRIGDEVREIRNAAVVPEGSYQAVQYRLAPLVPGRIVRGEVLGYRPAGESPDIAPAAVQARPARAVADDARVESPRGQATDARPVAGVEAAAASLPIRPAAGTPPRTRWRVDEGEEARLTPDEPTTAVIESLGALPLRARSEAMGVHHRPEFPGSCVLLGGLRLEVVAEQPLDMGVRYLLDPWPDEAVIRGTVAYGPALVRAAQDERRRAFDRERAARWSLAVAPLVGLLPEERQLLACDRLGLDPYVTTFAGASLEVATAVGCAVSVDLGPATLYFAEFLGLVLVLPALLRLLGLLLAKETSGNWLLGATLAAGETLGIAGAARADTTVLPLTRSAFWARLARPDGIERQPDGSLVCTGLLPHLSWGGSLTHRVAGVPPSIRVGNDYWSVSAMPPSTQSGRLVYPYLLWPQRDEGMLKDLPDPPPPDPRHYTSEVLDGVAREWDDLLGAAPWLPTLLPRAVQERAYRGRGGAAAAQRWTVLTAVGVALAGVWMLLGKHPVSVVTGLLLIGDAAWRVWRTLQGDYAPSLVGGPVAGLLRPERIAYQSHLEAERAALRRRAGSPQPT
jgi:hypothetical protein